MTPEPVSSPLSLTNTALKRRQFIKDVVDRVGSILEIGAFDNPTFRREMGDDVEFADWFSREELIQSHSNNKNRKMERIVGIDFIVKHNRLSEAVAGKFDVICASHVIEHIPDVINWLNELSAMLHDNGRVFLAVPDKRYTFDYYRGVSTATEMIRAHEEGLEKPSKWQLLDHLYYHQSVDLAALWAGESAPDFRPRWSLAQASQMADKKAKIYTDCHCWTFSAATFSHLISDLTSAELCDLTIEALSPPKHKSNEFHVLLRKARTK